MLIFTFLPCCSECRAVYSGERCLQTHGLWQSSVDWMKNTEKLTNKKQFEIVMFGYNQNKW